MILSILCSVCKMFIKWCIHLIVRALMFSHLIGCIVQISSIVLGYELNGRFMESILAFCSFIFFSHKGQWHHLCQVTAQLRLQNLH
jgi:hypothetical protein